MSLASGGQNVQVLSSITFSVLAKERFAIIGRSGSGKSTLLGLLAGLDAPSSGEIYINGVDLGKLNEEELASFRLKNIGYVFQSYHLIPTLTAVENIALPLELCGNTDAFGYARELLADVGLISRAHHYPIQLSGGEQQRVALARAFANRPSILLADEPTGNLDTSSSHQVIDLLLRFNDEYGTTLVIVTHDTALSSLANHILTLDDGYMVSDDQVAR